MIFKDEKKHHLYTGIARKLIVSIILFSSFITLIITAIQLYQGYKYDLEIIDSRFQQINDVHLTSLTNFLWLADKKETLIHLNGILKTPDIQYLEIKEQGKLWVSTGSKNQEKIKSRTYKLRYTYKNKIHNIGALKVVASLDNTYQHIYDRALIVLITNGIKTSLVALFIFILFYNIVSRHLTKISDFALEKNPLSSNKILSLNRKSANKDELDVVVASINDMRLNLSKQQQENQYILENMVDGIFTVNEKGIILTINQSAKKLFGYESKEILGHYFKLLIPEFYVEQYGEFKSSDSKSNDFNSSKTCTIKGVRKDGESFPMHLLVRELPHTQSQGHRFIATCHDLTLQTQQEEQLRRSQKMDALGKLTGGVAHDYNNMLGVIMGYAELLQHNLVDKTDLSGYANEIYHAGERGAQLTKKLLSFSRQKQSETQSININTVLKGQKDMLAKSLTARIKIVMNLEEKLWPVKLEGGDLEDVILNLSINAMHAMTEVGTLTITSRNDKIDDSDTNYMELHPGDYVALSISDTGTGMDEVTKSQIFDPFFSTKGEKGTGLGLSQVYGFIHRSKGGIKVYSELGHGTRIVLYFPRNTLKEDLSQKPKEKKEKVLKGSETILVVDDEPSLVSLASNILTVNGYHVLTSTSAKEALVILKNESVDLLLSDIIMPNMDGYQLASEVKQHYPQINIILCSGFDDGRHVDMVDDILQSQILHKPYSSKSLLKQIRESLDGNT